MTNEEAIALLEDTKKRLFQAVSADAELSIDPRLAFTLGTIMGAITEGVAAFREDRQIRYARMRGGFEA